MEESGLTVTVLRELLRHFQEFQVLVEDNQIDTLSWGGQSYSFWDLQKIYEYSQKILPKRQKQAIRLCLIRNMKEKDAAIEMGVSITNPVAMYATKGLSKVLKDLEEGKIPGIRMRVSI